MGALGYATPAVAHGRVFAAAYDGGVRALLATSGAVLWSRNVGGRISGTPVVVGNLVFVSTLEGKTYALRVGNGRIVWRFDAGAYVPGIATDRLYYFAWNGLLAAFRGAHSPPVRR